VKWVLFDKRSDPTSISGELGMLFFQTQEYHLIELLLDKCTKHMSIFVPQWLTILKKMISLKRHDIAEKIIERKFTVVNLTIAQLAGISYIISKI
jgi:hypothetical protein